MQRGHDRRMIFAGHEDSEIWRVSPVSSSFFIFMSPGLRHFQVAADTLVPDACREPAWSESVAVGDKEFVEQAKEGLGCRVYGRKVYESLDTDMCFLREPACSSRSDSGMKNGPLSVENGLLADISVESSIG